MLKTPLLLAMTTLLAPPAAAWGPQGHKMLATAALKDLPPGLAPWFAGNEAILPAHANDPDHWKLNDPLEPPRHFLDCEAYGGADQVPQDEGAARSRLGPDVFQRSGQVPWTILARVGELTAAFQDGDRPRIALQASWLSHYVGDLSVPLHTTSNYNGDQTGQHGVHQRWESGLVERIEAREGWTLEVRPAVAAGAPQAEPWAWLAASNALVAGVLRDDLAAQQASTRAGAGHLSPLYWDAYLQLQEPHVKEQLNLAAQRTAEMILLAWTNAGSPAQASR